MPGKTESQRPLSWSRPVTEFRSSRGFLPHLEEPGGCYWVESTTHGRQELSATERDIVLSAIFFFDGDRYDLNAVVVMPDHVHLILRPRSTDAGFYSLRQICHSLKSYTAKKIIRDRGIPTELRKLVSGRTLRTSGVHIWQEEYFDHLIRNEADYFEKLTYLLHNPVEAGLAQRPEDYPWLWYQGMPRHPLQRIA